MARGERWRLTAASTLLYTLAFNLTFFVQELFLVLPKALTPGLRPVLFHNDHRWDGEHPLAGLFQGTGALATLLMAGACAALLRRGRGSPTLRLLLVWLAYCGCFMALLQVVVGAFSPRSDLGMAMAYFRLGPAGKTMAALAAVAAMLSIASWLGRAMLGLAPEPLPGAAARSGFVFRAATLPSLLALPLIVAFRVPREWIEVLIVPLVVSVVGTALMQAGALRMSAAPAGPAPAPIALGWPAAAVLALLAFFQLVLRPGVRFY